MGTIIEFFKLLLFGLVPPDEPVTANGAPTPEEIVAYRKGKRRWRRSVALSLWALLAVAVVGYFWANIKFAHADEVKQEIQNVKNDVTELKSQLTRLKGQTNRIELSQLKAQLYDNRKLQCEAFAAADRPRAKTYTELLTELKDQYKTIKGEAWDMPPCNEL